MKLVIAEKPSVAQSIARVIGATGRKDGYAKGQPCVSASCYKDLEKWLQERRARTVRKMMKEGENANV